MLVREVLEEHANIIWSGVESNRKLGEGTLACLLEDAFIGYRRLLVACPDLGDARAERLHDANGIAAAAQTNLISEMLFLEGVALGGEVIHLHGGILGDDINGFVMREDGTQPRLGCDRKADVYGVALSHRQKLIRSVGLINHILDETDSLAGMNDVLPDFVHI